MGKKILEAILKVAPITHRKKTKEGKTEYHYGAITLHNPDLVKYIGKEVKIRVEEK